MKTNVLVTGADQHQGLAVIRGLGMKGVHVVAASAKRHNIGFYSRYAKKTDIYTAPNVDLDRFIEDILDIIKRHKITMIIPAVESTMVALDNRREQIEEVCVIAAPDSMRVEMSIDKLRTVELAQKVGVPVPKTICTDNIDEAIEVTRSFRFPVALKPRGNSLHPSTQNALGFKVRYAKTHAELQEILKEFRLSRVLPMIQEYVRGVGVCVSALFNKGKPVSMFPYRRLREVPLTGGVSVVRQGIVLEEQLEEYVTKLLEEIQWHGIAMVEFKFDELQKRYTLMEINGRFQASTALSLDSGLNFPYMVYNLYSDPPVEPKAASYRPGEIERWLRGDINALINCLLGITQRDAVPEARRGLPSKGRVIYDFLKDFRPGVHFDEFKVSDPNPGLFEAIECSKLIAGWCYRALRASTRKGFSLIARTVSTT
jgi:predicted ATP-grasp superfamily ATP-dependent carboligase